MFGSARRRELSSGGLPGSGESGHPVRGVLRL